MNNATRAQWALTLLRSMVGIVFIAHGGQKVLGIFGGTGLSAFASWITQLGVPFYAAYLAAFAEFIGGIMLLLGVYAELGALMIMPVMAGALFLVHKPHGFFIQNNGFEYVLCLLVILFSIILAGPGYLSLLRYRR